MMHSNPFFKVKQVNFHGPRHFYDIVKFSKYWYEILYHGSVYTFIEVIFYIVIAGAFLNIRYLHHFKTLSMVCISGIGTNLLFFISSYYLWTSAFNFNYPIPFFGYTCSFASRIFCCVSTWFIIPAEWRSQEGLKKKLKYSIFWILATIPLSGWYQGLFVILRNFRGQYQPLIAFAFPVSRELWVWLLTKMARNCANGDERGTIIACLYALYTNHTICLSYIIGSIADDATSWILMATDFSLNVYLCITVVWTQKRNPSDVTNIINMLQELAISELVEFQSPLCFILIFALAYYTPIGSLVGNVSNGYWAYEAVENIYDTLSNMMVFFFVDLASSIVNTMVLRVSCQINILQAIANLQKEFFATFILYLAYLNMGVSRNLYPCGIP